MKKLIAILMCLMIAVPFAASAESGLMKLENGATGDFDGDGTEEPVAFVERGSLCGKHSA